MPPVLPVPIVTNVVPEKAGDDRAKVRSKTARMLLFIIKNPPIKIFVVSLPVAERL